ncbi:MAG: hdfR 4 [Firmicutes bacterium]|nr:hdfR 4 [Bacillota bacterium]
MNIESLRSFLLVAKYSSFSKAAEVLYTSQPTLSKKIADLEKELGIQLFVRDYHATRLTAAGSNILKECIEIVDRYDNVFKLAQESRQGVVKKVRIGNFESEYFLISRFLEIVRTRFPDVDLDINTYSPRRIDEGVENNEIDIGFRPLYPIERKSGLNICEVHKARMCFLLPRNHKYANKESIDIFSLKQESFILLSPEFDEQYDWFTQYCEKRGITPKIINHYSRTDTLFLQVAAGNGISIAAFDSAFLKILRKNLSLVTISGEDAFVKIGIVWKADNPNPLVASLIEEYTK